MQHTIFFFVKSSNYCFHRRGGKRERGGGAGGGEGGEGGGGQVEEEEETVEGVCWVLYAAALLWKWCFDGGEQRRRRGLLPKQNSCCPLKETAGICPSKRKKKKGLHRGFACSRHGFEIAAAVLTCTCGVYTHQLDMPYSKIWTHTHVTWLACFKRHDSFNVLEETWLFVREYDNGIQLGFFKLLSRYDVHEDSHPR